MPITATKQQTIFDIALQTYGDVSGVAELLIQHPELLRPLGTVAQFGATYNFFGEPINKVVADIMVNLKPTTE